VDAAAGTLTTATALPAGCTAVTFTAGATEPWVVRGSASGWLGRAEAGAVFTSVEGIPFSHLPGYQPGRPAMTLRLVLPPDYLPAAGHVLSVLTTDGFAPLTSRVETSGGSLGFPLLYLPGALTVLGPSPYHRLGSIWTAYPSANAVVSFAPVEINPLASFRKIESYQ